MKEVTITVSNVPDITGLKTLQLGHYDVWQELYELLRGISDKNIEIDIRQQPKRWPKLNMGDTFKYNKVEFMFVSYPSKHKVKAISTEDMLNNQQVSFVYFDDEITDGVKF